MFNLEYSAGCPKKINSVLCQGSPKNRKIGKRVYYRVDKVNQKIIKKDSMCLSYKSKAQGA